MPFQEFPKPESIEPMDLTALRTEFVRLRRRLKYTQSFVAGEYLGITQATLSAWETGKNQSMRTETLNKLIHLVGQWRRQQVSVEAEYGVGGNNIVLLGRGNISKEQRIDSSSFPEVDGTDVQDQERIVLEGVIRGFLGPDRAGGALLRELPFDELVKLYGRVKRDQLELEILSGKW